ncbi:unnamed protein product, partial [Effrenium voratum]
CRLQGRAPPSGARPPLSALHAESGQWQQAGAGGEAGGCDRAVLGDDHAEQSAGEGGGRAVDLGWPGRGAAAACGGVP